MHIPQRKKGRVSPKYLINQEWKICNLEATGDAWLIFKALLQLFSSEFWQQDLKKKEKYVKKKGGTTSFCSGLTHHTHTHTPPKYLLQFSKENGLLTPAIGIKDTLMQSYSTKALHLLHSIT